MGGVIIISEICLANLRSGEEGGRQAGRLGGWEDQKSRRAEVKKRRRLGGWKAGKLESCEAGKVWR
jgi:hypothetical protein